MNKPQQAAHKAFDYFIHQRHCRDLFGTKMQVRRFCERCRSYYWNKQVLIKIRQEVLKKLA